MRHAYLCIYLLVILLSCKKNVDKPINYQKREEIELKKVFGASLAKALQAEPKLRDFIKLESLKQFDNDYDVLFQAVKNTRINGSKTFEDLLLENTTLKKELETAINELPLLTIFVPTVPNFSAEAWDTKIQIPKVAIEPNADIILSQSISAVDAEGKNIEIPLGEIPGFPVLVIKNSERVIVDGSKYDLSNQYLNGKEEKVPYLSIDGLDFSFTSKAFDGRRSSKATARTGNNVPSTGTYTIDKVNVDAYYSGAEWHRDHVYYGINPNAGIFNGVYRNHFHEFIKSFKFINKDDYFTVSDASNDPKFNAFRKEYETGWTEGNYEFYVDIVVNSKNGTGSILHKSFTCKGSDLFIPDWQPVIPGASTYYTKKIKSAKEYNPNMDLIPWDLENYGNAWKFVISEYDISETTTRTVTHSSTFATNFEINLSTGEKRKIGTKFGISSTTQNTTQTVYTYTTGSDQLGEGIIAFDYNIISSYTFGPTQPPSYQYNTYEVSTGRISLSVEPTRVF